jgi:O-antigen/teichoic acid export membrane protein
MQQMDRKIGIGVLWNLASIFMSRGASMIFTLFLARLLAPEAFGLIAMITVCFELARVFVESGMGQAIIQSKHVSPEDLSTVFIANLALSSLAYIILFFSAPYVAVFYRQPELTLLVRIMGVVVFLNAAKAVQIAALSREMNFKVPMKANTLGVVVSGLVAVCMAYLGAGVWSLVGQVLVAGLVSAAVLWLASTWRPALSFDLASFKKLFGFGVNLLMEGILEVGFRNSYLLVIGRFFSAELTGLYFFARRISNLISQELTAAVQKATFPALSTLQDENTSLRHKYRQIIQLMMFMIAPAMLLLAALAAPLFSLLFDSRWQGAIPYLQLLCVIGMLYPLHALNINILNVKGRSDLVLKVGLVKKIVNLILLFFAIPFGVLGIVISQVIGSCLALIPNTYFAAKLIDYGLAKQLVDVFKPVFAAWLAALGVWEYAAVSSLPQVWLLCVGGSLGLMIYFGISFVIRSEGLLLITRKARLRFRAAAM